MRVVATKPGYLGKLRAVDDEFEVPEGAKASWFQPVEQKAKGGVSKAPAPKKTADDLV